MATGFGFIVIREVERTEEVFPNNGYFPDIPAPVLQFCSTRRMATLDSLLWTIPRSVGTQKQGVGKPSKHTCVLHGGQGRRHFVFIGTVRQRQEELQYCQD